MRTGNSISKGQIRPAAAALMPAYAAGDSDTRPWGGYIVTDVGINDKGEEFCEKAITVNPGHILSLQSHEHRREYWRVEKGVLDVVLDGRHFTLAAGQEIRIPVGSIHCMANTNRVPCVVYERQEGVCREDDIKRYADAYGRGADISDDPRITASLHIFNQLLPREIHPALRAH